MAVVGRSSLLKTIPPVVGKVVVEVLIVKVPDRLLNPEPEANDKILGTV